MVIDTSDNNQYSYLLCPKTISKITWPDPTEPDHTTLWQDLFRKVLKMGTWNYDNIDSSLEIVLSKFMIDIFGSLETMRFLASEQFSYFSAVFLTITFDWKGNFQFWWFHRKYVVQIHRSKPYFKFKKENIFSIYIYTFLGEKPRKKI